MTFRFVTMRCSVAASVCLSPNFTLWSSFDDVVISVVGPSALNNVDVVHCSSELLVEGEVVLILRINKDVGDRVYSYILYMSSPPKIHVGEVVECNTVELPSEGSSRHQLVAEENTWDGVRLGLAHVECRNFVWSEVHGRAERDNRTSKGLVELHFPI